MIGIKGLKGSCFLIIASIMMACNAEKKAPLPYSDMEKAPAQAVYDVKSVFTDEGKVQMKMDAPILLNYPGEQGVQVFPDGIHSVSYSETGAENVDIVSDSAINVQTEDLMKFYGNVVVTDYRSGDILYTEALYWNRKTKKIYSNVHVRQEISSGMILEGDGFDSDENMDNVRLRRPRGVIL